MNTQKSNSPVFYIVLTGLILALVAVYYSYNIVVKSMTVDPVKVFSDNFNLEPSQVSDINGGGELSGYFNVYIRFKYSGQQLRLKDSAGFTEKDPVDAIQWFVIKYPDDESLKGKMEDYNLLNRTNSTPAHIKNEWLLSNKKTGQYYFRYWGQ